jgi:hypothetical protein
MLPKEGTCSELSHATDAMEHDPLGLDSIMYDSQHLDLTLIAGHKKEVPFVLPWLLKGVPVGWIESHTLEQWRDFVAALGLPAYIPEIVSAKFKRAQMLYFLSWLYGDLIKAGELVALTALELALRDCYGNKVKGRRGQQPEFWLAALGVRKLDFCPGHKYR